VGELDRGPNVERARVYRALATLFRFPSEELRADLRERQLPELRSALGRLEADESLLETVAQLASRIAEVDARELEQSYERTFEASGGLRCSPHETVHAVEKPVESMLRTFELADIAGFYRAFGVEVSPGTERVDHIVAELEFMHLLAVKESIAEREGTAEQVEICRDAARAFLADHLSRWAGRFAERLEESGTDRFYAGAGCLFDRFVALDTARLRA
jgi:DMSO reductase family type II enzyme chaperone